MVAASTSIGDMIPLCKTCATIGAAGAVPARKLLALPVAFLARGSRVMTHLL
jgi:hypothetical protein